MRNIFLFSQQFFRFFLPEFHFHLYKKNEIINKLKIF